MKPVLENSDRQSPTWKKLEKYLQEQIETLRARNDAHRDEKQTAVLRGRIAAVKDLLSLGTDAPKVPSDDALFKD